MLRCLIDASGSNKAALLSILLSSLFETLRPMDEPSEFVEFQMLLDHDLFSKCVETHPSDDSQIVSIDALHFGQLGIPLKFASDDFAHAKYHFQLAHAGHTAVAMPLHLVMVRMHTKWLFWCQIQGIMWLNLTHDGVNFLGVLNAVNVQGTLPEQGGLMTTQLIP